MANTPTIPATRPCSTPAAGAEFAVADLVAACRVGRRARAAPDARMPASTIIPLYNYQGTSIQVNFNRHSDWQLTLLLTVQAHSNNQSRLAAGVVVSDRSIRMEVP